MNSLGSSVRRSSLTCLMIAGGLVGAGCTYFLGPIQAASAQEAGGGSEAHDRAYLASRMFFEAGRFEEAGNALKSLLNDKDCPDYITVAAAEAGLAAAAATEKLIAQPGAEQNLPNHAALRKQVDEAYVTARGLVERGLERDPRSLRLLRLEARMQAFKGDEEGAIATLNRALELAPGRTALLEDLGDLHLKRLQTVTTQDELKTRIEALVDVYERMLAARQGYERLAPLLVLSSLYERLGNTESQLRVAQEAVEINPREVRCRLALGRALTNAGRDEEALENYRAALQKNSSSVELRASIEETLGRMSDATRRVAFYKQLGEDFPDDPQLQMLSAVSMFQSGEWETGEARLQHFAARWPESTTLLASARVEQAAALRAANRPKEALAAYRQALESDPENSDARLQAEVLLQEMNDPAEREAFYAGLAARFPDNRGFLEMCAKVFFAASEWTTAERYLLDIQAKWPESEYAHIALVHTWLELDRIDEAAAMARKMAERGEEFAPAAILTVVEKQIAANRAADAASLLGILIEKQPENMLVTILAVQTYAGLGQYEQAHKVLGGISSDLFQKHKSDLLYMKAGLYQREGRMQDALDVMEGLIAEHADQSMYYRDSGIILQEMGSHEKAEAYYHKAVELGPDDAENYNTLGYFYAETNQKLDKALELINKALEMEPEAGHIIDSRGWVYYRRGEYALAVEDLKRAAELVNPPDAVIYDHLGDAQFKLGDVAAARNAWERALELDGKQDAIRKKLDGIPTTTAPSPTASKQ